MKKLFKVMLVLSVIALSSCGPKYNYEAVEGDPMNAMIYTMDNGMKIYMAVNDETPRIQANIAVKVGGKNDPAETTGLAHYFEHLMFKGTEKFGTTNYEAEKPLLDEIERLFEVYRSTTDEEERTAIYKVIDSVSYEASKFAIPNEYDKLMAAIGAQGTNAYTSQDITCYIEDIPANQVDNWAKVQADRFENSVIRGFHTELETVYEEKNMSLTNDGRKVREQMLAALFPNHPYGTQTVLGTQEHLKNPSITTIKEYYKTWYQPNNIAVCVSGDFDPDEMVETIEKYFGHLQPNNNLPKLEIVPEKPITKPIERVVYGLNAENVTIAWPTAGANSDEVLYGQIIGGILNNGQAGLFDINLNQEQKVLSSYAYMGTMVDHGFLMAQARPKAGQTLDQAKDLMLAEIDKLRKGEWDEELLEATVNNYKLQVQNYIDTNGGRADVMVSSFTNGTSWADEVTMLDDLAKITKEDVMAFATRKFDPNGYVVIYKREGKDPNEQTISKPTITPIVTNRDMTSDFLAEVQNSDVKLIEPIYLDYEKDLTKFTTDNNIEVVYKENPTNDLFDLNYVFEIGGNNDPLLREAFRYIDYLGTSTKTAAEIAAEYYSLACWAGYYVQDNRLYISIGGLSENMEKAMALTEELLFDAQPDEAILENMKTDILKRREDAKLNQNANFGALQRYATYGEEYIEKVIVPNSKIKSLTSQELLDKIGNVLDYEHRVLYYGPETAENVSAAINNNHKVGKMLPTPEKVVYPLLETPENKVILAQYDAPQIYFIQYTNLGEKFDIANDAEIRLYNSYFGGGMNAIVFQEMREARGLAYSANARLSIPRQLETPYNYTAFIATQNDKMGDAIDAFAEIINNMPESEAAFNIAKESIISDIRTNRTIKSDVLWSYVSACDMGIDCDRDEAVFEKVQTMTLADVKATQEKWVKDRNYTYCILGDINDLDMKKLVSIGEVSVIPQEKIFGY